MSSIGHRIRAARSKRNQTLLQFANALGCREQTIWRWENDKSRPSAAMLRRLQPLLGVSIGTLLNEVTAPRAA
jgi:transcriptional regulator with XRE-family HTH domain